MTAKPRKTRSLTPERSAKWVQKTGDVLFGALMQNHNVSPPGSPQRKGSRGRGRSPKRVVSAGRDLKYMNILATDDMVTTECIEECLELCGSNRNITKLELEDIISRKSDQEDIFAAILGMLKTDDENNIKRQKKNKDTRTWEYIKFVDCIRVMADHNDDHGSSKAMFELCEYEDNQHQLWNLIKCNAYDDANHRKPVSFHVKLEIDEGVELTSLLKIFKLWQGSSLEKVEFGGALFGCNHDDIPGKLATEVLQIKEVVKENDDDPDNQKSASSFLVTERIIVDVFYTLPHLSTMEPPTVIKECVHKLTSLKENDEATFSNSWAKSKSGGKKSPPRGRKKSPKRVETSRRNGVTNLEIVKKKSGDGKGTNEAPKRVQRKGRTGVKPPASKKKLRRRTVSIDDFAANLKILRKESGDVRRGRKKKTDNSDDGNMSD